MLENLLSRNEGKTLEFKETTQSLKGIIKRLLLLQIQQADLLLLA